MHLTDSTNLKTPSQPLIPGLDLKSFLKFAINPTDTQAVFDIQASMLKAPNRSEMIASTVTALESSDTFMELYRQRYIPEFPTTEDLLAQPEGSLGRIVGNHLKSNGIRLDFAGLNLDMIYLREMNLLTYIAIRGLRIHDIIHAVLGLGVSPIDEYAHASFTLAQYHSPFHMMIVASGNLHTAFYEPSEIPRFLETTNRYYRMGASAAFITGYDFENNFATPMMEVRRQLRLPDVL